MEPLNIEVPPLTRRRFVRCLAAGSCAALLDWPALSEPKVRPVATLYRWFPRFRAPRELWAVPFAADPEEGMILESAAGLAARRVLEGDWDTLIYEDVANDGYQRWFAAYCSENQPRVIKLTLDQAVTRLRSSGIVRGYHLFHLDRSARPLHSAGPMNESANVATSLAGAHGALVASEGFAGRLDKLGLAVVLDLRDRTESWCLDQSTFSRGVLGTADPKTRHARSMMIALNAFVCSGRGPVYEAALQRCQPDAPVLGWGCEAEDRLTMPSSRWGLFQTATNWCHNLPVFASDAAGERALPRLAAHSHRPAWSNLDWGDGFHHVNFTLTDGDNVQWIMGNFTGGHEAPSYYGHPGRGRMPFTWGLPITSLGQLSPRTLIEILGRATPNDDFVAYNGGGYFYPDLYGHARGDVQALALHAERLRGYMELTGVRLLAFNFQDWDGPAAHAACEQFAKVLPGLLGILAFQYYPYSAGDGAIAWVKGAEGDEVPIVSCRLTLWAQTGRPRDTTPAAAAAWLNRLPRAGGQVGADCFSWVLVHAWSRFRRVQPGAPLDAEAKDVPQEGETPGAVRGYEPALWTAERLDRWVRPVTAEELMRRVRLRLRPQATLTRWLAEAEAATDPAPRSAEAIRDLAEARALLPLTGSDQAAARRCFEFLKRAVPGTGPARI